MICTVYLRESEDSVPSSLYLDYIHFSPVVCVRWRLCIAR